MFSQIAKRTLATGIVKNSFKAMNSPLATRSMSSLVEKEMSEEVRYIRKQEAEAMKAKLEKILAMDDSSSEKQELAKIIGKLKINKNKQIKSRIIKLKKIKRFNK